MRTRDGKELDLTSRIAVMTWFRAGMQIRTGTCLFTATGRVEYVEALKEWWPVMYDPCYDKTWAFDPRGLV
jgi:hypothetical protein